LQHFQFHGEIIFDYQFTLLFDSRSEDSFI